MQRPRLRFPFAPATLVIALGLAFGASAQAQGRDGIFANYRLRVATVMRDYGLTERDEAPRDSRDVHG